MILKPALKLDSTSSTKLCFQAVKLKNKKINLNDNKWINDCFKLGNISKNHKKI
jgi:hypothetical protein